MIKSHVGEYAALFTALFWTLGALVFEVASKRAGALTVNWLRLCIGFVLLSLFCLVGRGNLLPLDAPPMTWFWLFLSGIVGFAIGDLLLFRAFAVIGARISMLIMASVPPITALIGWIVMGETLPLLSLIGMTLTVGGIVLVVLERRPQQKNSRLSYPIFGTLLALGAALGQSVGLVLSKYGMGSYNAFAATQIRIIAGIVGSSFIFFIMKRWERIGSALRSRQAMVPISIGAVLGPFLGVSLSLVSIQHTTTGVASTIMALVPVLIIPPAIILFKEKVTLREIFGAFIAVAGVTFFFL